MNQPQQFQVISPIDGSVYAERTFATTKDIEQALTAAEKARVSWKQSKLTERIALCQKVVKYFVHHAEAIGQEITHQMGRPIRYSSSEISSGFVERAHFMISQAEAALQDQVIEDSDDFHRLIRRSPLGTVLVLAPWNYPYLTSVNVIIPAILAGNAVILKHAVQTPLCAERYQAAFEFADAPEGLFQYLHLTHQQVSQLVSDERIQGVAFTGSVEGGLAMKRSLVGRFIPVGLELGGKDPAYVRADADLEHTIENVVDGVYFNSGQSCCGIERIYVDQQLFDSFVEGFVAKTKSYVLGNPLDHETTIGPMVRASAVDHVSSHYQDAQSRGAHPLIDPIHFPQGLGAAYYAPQALTDVSHAMKIMMEETFGPIVGIMPVHSDEEAIEKMNDSPYGLSASVWTSDTDRGFQLCEQIETGTCFVNRCDYLDPALAWTGVKNSGIGVTLSSLGYTYLTRAKSFHIRK